MPSYGFMTCVYTTEKISEAIGYPSFPSWFGKNSTEKKKQKTCKVIKKWFLPCDSVFKLEGYKTALQSTPAARTNIAFEEGECGGSCDADRVIQIDACHTKLAPN